MQEEQNVKWVLIVSLVMIFISALFIRSFNYYSRWDALERVIFYAGHASILFFVATVTTATLFMMEFGKKVLMLKILAYLFIISMVLFSIGILNTLFAY